MREPSLARGRPRLTGVVDTLSVGYGVVNRHPWIIIIPVLLDLFLWLGPQFSVARLVSQTLSRIVPLAGASARMFDERQLRDVVEAAEGFNLLVALAPSVVGVPSFVAALGIQDPLRSTAVDSWAVAALIFGAASLGGLLLGSIYYSIMAEEVRDSGISVPRLVGHSIRSWTRVLLYYLLLAALGVLYGVPLGFLAVSSALVSPALGSLAVSAVMMGLVWAGVYLFFVPDAIFLSQVGPLQAIKNSVAVVRVSFWATLAIVVLIIVVLLGMARVWELAAQSVVQPWGTGLGIIGNAYIASGVIAASMSFYQERIEYARANRPSPVERQPPDEEATEEA